VHGLRGSMRAQRTPHAMESTHGARAAPPQAASSSSAPAAAISP
jgi:hypothetical protein